MLQRGFQMTQALMPVLEKSADSASVVLTIVERGPRRPLILGCLRGVKICG